MIWRVLSFAMFSEDIDGGHRPQRPHRPLTMLCRLLYWPRNLSRLRGSHRWCRAPCNWCMGSHSCMLGVLCGSRAVHGCMQPNAPYCGPVVHLNNSLVRDAVFGFWRLDIFVMVLIGNSGCVICFSLKINQIIVISMYLVTVMNELYVVIK